MINGSVAIGFYLKNYRCAYELYLKLEKLKLKEKDSVFFSTELSTVILFNFYICCRFLVIIISTRNDSIYFKLYLYIFIY